MKYILLVVVFFNSNLFAQDTRHYSNPILSGFYPDPSICRVGNDYYLITSSFAYFPGIPIMHSKDLVSWRQIGYALNRKSQLDLNGHQISRGLFAPAISFIDSLFYITCTLVDKGGNFIISASDPKGPWSDPVFLPEIDGIDPALAEDGDKTYIIYNSIPPDNKSEYDGHRTIRMNEIDLKTKKIISNDKILINGGVDISKHPVWIEAPHIIQKDGWYYLYCAEGGTEYNHSEVVFRSNRIDGPYIPFDKNPILTQRHLDKERKNPITSTGHAQLVETPFGEWYAVFLGCRPYTNDHYNTGRETFMTPVKWIDGWPIINPDHETIQSSYPIPKMDPTLVTSKTNEFATNQKFFDHFDDTILNNRYTFLRTPSAPWHVIKKSNLEITLLPEDIAGNKNISMVADRQNHLNGYAMTRMLFTANDENEKAGLIVFQNENHYYYLCKSAMNGVPVVQLWKGPGNNNATAGAQLLNSFPIKQNNAAITMKITVDEKGYSFYYSLNKRKWHMLRSSMDREFLSTKTAGGFVGCMYGMYATSGGKGSKNKAYFDWFEKNGE